MDETLQQRLGLYRQMPEISRIAVDAVSEELAAMDDGTLTDESAGMFVSHAISAISRLVNGQPVVEGPTDAVFQSALVDDPGAEDAARAMAQRLGQRIGRDLPESEVRFLAVHLALLNYQRTKES